MEEIYEAVHQLLTQGDPVVIITAIRREGSAPRGVGAKMLTTQGKEIFGTIGGGKVEEDVLAEAHQMFQTRDNRLKAFDMSHEDLVPGHMVCGGRMEFLLEYVAPNEKNCSFFDAVKDGYNSKQSLLVTTVWGAEETNPVISRGLAAADGLIKGDLTLDEETLKHVQDRSDSQKQPALLAFESIYCWIEPLLDQGKLILFGAGHVALPVAQIANLAGFQVLALDDREEYASSERFPPPMAVKVVKDFDNCLSEIEVDENSYLVIVTRAHVHDKTVLAQALQSKAGYIGMIGSRKKRRVIYTALRDEGVSDEVLEQVYSPIGLEINAETPEEIAVSIMAELIKVRAEKMRD